MKKDSIENICVMEWLSICVDSAHCTGWDKKSDEYKLGWKEALDRVIDIELDLFDWFKSMSEELRSKLITLIEDWSIFVNHRDGNFVLAINCSDLFAYASADAESVSLNEIENFYSFCYDENNKKIEYGSDVYACLKRKEQPIDPVKKQMIERGLWTDELEGLEKNYCESVMQ